MAEDKRSLLAWVAAAGVVASLILSGFGAWNALKAAIVADLQVEMDALSARVDRNNAENQLHIACWAQAVKEATEFHLATYIYCTKGKIAKDAISK